MVLNRTAQSTRVRAVLLLVGRFLLGGKSEKWKVESGYFKKRKIKMPKGEASEFMGKMFLKVENGELSGKENGVWQEGRTRTSNYTCIAYARGPL